MSLFPSMNSAARQLAKARQDLWELADRADTEAAVELRGFVPGTLRSVRALVDDPEGKFDVLTEHQRQIRQLCARALTPNLADAAGSACAVVEAAIVGAIAPENAARSLETIAQHLRVGSAPTRMVFVRAPR